MLAQWVPLVPLTNTNSSLVKLQVFPTDGVNPLNPAGDLLRESFAHDDYTYDVHAAGGRAARCTSPLPPTCPGRGTLHFYKGSVNFANKETNNLVTPDSQQRHISGGHHLHRAGGDAGRGQRITELHHQCEARPHGGIAHRCPAPALRL